MRTAREKTFADLIRGNVAAHMADADFFVADVTGSNPNVMLELGGALLGRQGTPTLLIAGIERLGEKPDLPADLGGHITGCSVRSASVDEMVAQLRDSFGKNEKLAGQLERSKREQFVSAESLKECTQDLLKKQEIYDRLSQRYRTASDWRAAKEEELEAMLGDQADLARACLKRILAKLPK